MLSERDSDKIKIAFGWIETHARLAITFSKSRKLHKDEVSDTLLNIASDIGWIIDILKNQEES